MYYKTYLNQEYAFLIFAIGTILKHFISLFIHLHTTYYSKSSAAVIANDKL